jgi:hypothetical protein
MLLLLFKDGTTHVMTDLLEARTNVMKKQEGATFSYRCSPFHDVITSLIGAPHFMTSSNLLLSVPPIS